MAAKYLEELEQAAFDYLGEGYSVIPMTCQKKGMVPWAVYQTRLPTPREVKGWFEGRDRGFVIAIVLGRIAGGLWVLDLDGGEAVKWAEANCPQTGRKVKTPGGGEHWYYVLPAGTDPDSFLNDTNVVPWAFENSPPNPRTGKKPAVDIRGSGGCAIAPPSMRKGRKYEWIATGEPTAWSIRESGLLAPPGRLARAPAPAQPPPRAPAPLRGRPPARGGRVRLEDVVLDVDVSGRLPEDPAREGERNKALAKLVGTWIAAGLDQETTKSLALAWNAGNIPPLTEKTIAATVESISRTHERRHKVEVPKGPEPGGGGAKPAPGLPVPPEILKPGGLLEEIVEYICRSTYTAPPLFALAMAICYVGTLMGEKVLTSTGLRTNMYVITLARSGSGKEGPIEAVKKLMHETGTAAGNLGASMLASSAALMSSLVANRNQLLLVDEIGDFVGTVKNVHNPHKTELIKDMKELFSSRGLRDKKYANSKQNFTIPWHNVCLYGTGVPSALWGALTMDDLKGGFIARTLIFDLDVEARDPEEGEIDESISQSLYDKVRGLNDIPRLFKDQFMKCPDPPKIPMTREAASIAKEFGDKYRKLQNSVSSQNFLDGIYGRVAELGRKLALIYAMSRTADGSAATSMPAAVEEEDVRKVVDLLEWHVPRVIEKIRDNVAYNSQDALKRRILAAVNSRKWLPESAAYRLSRDCNHRQVVDALNLLTESEEIAYVVTNGKKGGYIPYRREGER
ncbi:MAG: bifunctional DNA primase/polymerase [Deltaproteobacteria bacterium]|jgi:hypothetical protein|nr:bifunctional DNA primase/polymerase [Deltaproteobacteria bacterium]